MLPTNNALGLPRHSSNLRLRPHHRLHIFRHCYHPLRHQRSHPLRPLLDWRGPRGAAPDSLPHVQRCSLCRHLGLSLICCRPFGSWNGAGPSC